MDIRQLEYFVAVADIASFSKAAEEQFISQTTMSYHISLLEKELGVRLLERDNKQVVLTPAGSCYLPKARQILRDLEHAREDARRAQQEQHERLRIGYFGRSCYGLLPYAIARLVERHPAVRIHTRQGRQSDLVHMLQAKELDCILCTDYGMFSQLGWIHRMCVFADPIQLLVRHDHWAAERSSIRTDELANERLVLYVEKRLWEQGPPEFPIDCVDIQYVDSHDDLVLLVRSGYAVSMGAGTALASEFGDLRLVPFEDYHQFDNNYLCWSKGDCTELLNDFIEIMRKISNEGYR